MCLKVKQTKAYKADAPIQCYKIVLESEFCHEKHSYTPYTLISIPKDVLDGKKPFLPTKNVDKFKDLIFGGVIHSFKNLQDAKKEAISLEKIIGSTYVIYECVIRKGVSYYEGEVSEGVCGYASKELMFVRKTRVKIPHTK